LTTEKLQFFTPQHACREITKFRVYNCTCHRRVKNLQNKFTQRGWGGYGGRDGMPTWNALA